MGTLTNYSFFRSFVCHSRDYTNLQIPSSNKMSVITNLCVMKDKSSGALEINILKSLQSWMTIFFFMTKIKKLKGLCFEFLFDYPQSL